MQIQQGEQRRKLFSSFTSKIEVDDEKSFSEL